MIFALSLFFSIVPITFYLIILWWLDKYEREPFRIIFYHFLWGMTGAVILSVLISALINNIIIKNFIEVDFQELASTIIIAPIVEEAFKGFILIITLNKIQFDNLTDGIVYGGSIGLGFGLTENFLYFFFGSENLSELLNLILMRDIFSISTHFVATASFGGIIALAKFKDIPRKIIFILTGFVISIVIHSMWNFLVSFEITFIAGIMMIIASLIIVFFLIQFSLSYEKHILMYELNDEIQNGYLNPQFASVIHDYKLRNKKGWIDESIRRDYINLATTLAFRKYQLKNITSGKLREHYQNEIITIRSKLNSLELNSTTLSN